MKAAFNFVSQDTSSATQLLVQLASDTLSFIWFTESPFQVKGIAIYNAAETISARDLKTIIAENNQHISPQLTVTICYDFPESVLVPGKFHRAGLNAEALALLYGDVANCSFNDDFITSADIYNHYRMPRVVGKELSTQFPNAKVFHSTSLQLEQLRSENDLLYCIVYHSRIKVILIKSGKLNIVQQFHYQGPVDAAYHLLNVCAQFAADPANIPLRVTGMIDENSILYAELYKYFGDISFEEKLAGDFDTREAAGLPTHFFSHLTALARCVS